MPAFLIFVFCPRIFSFSEQLAAGMFTPFKEIPQASYLDHRLPPRRLCQITIALTSAHLGVFRLKYHGISEEGGSIPVQFEPCWSHFNFLLKQLKIMSAGLSAILGVSYPYLHKQPLNTSTFAWTHPFQWEKQWYYLNQCIETSNSLMVNNKAWET